MILKSYEIKKNISNFLKYNFYLLYGENYGLKKEIKNLIIKEIKQKNDNTETLNLYENDVTDNEKNFHNSIFSGSLFSDKKIITINNCTDKTTNQIKYITEKNPENILLIIHSNVLDKKSKLRNFFETSKKTLCIPCYLDNQQDLEKIAIKNLAESNLMLSREVINLLIEKSNNDRNNLINEIEKIKLFALNKKKLEINEIKALINFAGEYKSDSLINECLCGNILQYKKIISELYMNTVNQIFLLRILSNKIRKLLYMKEIEKKYNNLDSLINSAKPPIFWKEKPIIKKQLSIWKLNELKEIINEIDTTEILCKKNPQVSKLIFFNLFSRICKKASSYS